MYQQKNLGAAAFLNRGSDDISKQIILKNWSSSALGSIEYWPQSLLTSLNISLQSNFPVILFWGDELNCFYNDSFKRVFNITLEIGIAVNWADDILSKMECAVRNSFKSNYANGADKELIIAINESQSSERTFSFFLTTIYNNEGGIAGVMATGSELKSEIEDRFDPANKADILKEIVTREHRFSEYIFASPVPIGIYIGKEMKIEIANDAILAAWGKDRSVVGKTFREALPELEDQPFFAILDNVYNTGIAYHTDGDKVDFNVDGELKSFYFNFTYTPLKDASGKVFGVLNTATDITEQILAKKRAEESEQLLRSLVQEASIPTSLLQGPNHVIALANEVTLRLWGKDKTIIGKSILEAMPELAGQPYPRILDHVYETGITYEGNENKAFIEVDGLLKEVYVNFIYKKLAAVEGAEPYILVMGYDVSDQVYARRRIEESEKELLKINQRLAVALEAGKLGSYELLLESGTMECSEQCKANFGLAANSVFNFPDLLSVIHEDDRDNMLSEVHKAILTNSYYNCEYRVIWPNGSLHWIKASGRALYNGHGMAEKMIGVTLDITESKTSLQKLIESEQRLNMSLDYTGTGTYDLNLVNNEIIYTSRLTEIFGYAPGEKLEHAALRSHVHPDDLSMVRAAYQRAMETGIYFYEARIVRCDNVTRWIRTQGRVIYDKRGKPLRMLGTIMDITNAKNEQNKKDEFIGIISHELRTPLTSIKALAQYLHLLSSETSNEASSSLLQKMLAQINKLNILIQDLLDVTKIEGGKMKFHFTDFVLSTLVTEVVDELKITGKRILVNDDSQKAIISGDRLRLEQVLVNLLTNAIKYSPDQDEIIVNIFKSEDSMVCSITDFGIGIAKESQPFVFDRFYREFDDQSNSFSGLGLGLYISAEIIHRQNGKIWLQSEKGKGSTFSFSMPLNIDK